MSLRTKLLLGFLIPAAMWLVVGIWSSAKMRSLGAEVEELLLENEKSIRYSNQMLEAIERIDSAVLLKIGGDDHSFLNIYDSAAAGFYKAEELARENITLEGEKELLDTLNNLQETYFARVGEVLAMPSLENYNQNVYPAFTDLRHRIQELGILNSEEMYRSAAGVVDSARRAALPADLIALAAIFFTIAFTWLIQLFVVNPIRKILQGVGEWNRSDKLILPTVETGDELQELSEELNRMNQKYQARK